MIEWIALPLVALILTVAGVKIGVPAWHSYHHAKALENIARLEIDMGLREAPRQLTVKDRWEAGVSSGAPKSWAVRSTHYLFEPIARPPHRTLAELQAINDARPEAEAPPKLRKPRRKPDAKA